MFPSVPFGFRGVFRTDDDARAVYSESAGIMRLLPLGVAIPRDAHDLQLLCAWAAEHGTALIPRGSGSSMSGAAVGAGIVVDMHRLQQCGAVDLEYRRLHVGAAVTRSQADAAARSQGLRLPVDPSSGAFATIGGMVATNAAGPRSMHFGAMRRWVWSVDCVFADGTSATITRRSPGNGVGAADAVGAANSTLQRWARAADAFRDSCRALSRRGVRKESSGYGVHDFADSGDLVDLLVGSEGTLAFFTGIELELAPVANASASLLSSWPMLEGAAHGAALAREAGAVACELLDATFLQVAGRGRTLPVPSNSECVLLVDIEDRESGFAHARASALADAWRSAGAATVLLGLDDESQEALWSLRHAASPILARLDPHVRSMQVVEDGCVPPERLTDYLRGLRAAFSLTQLEGVLFGHAGDAHIHANALVDVRKPDWQGQVRALFDRVADLTEQLGGTMSGEHGDGRLRSPLLQRFWPQSAIGLFEQLKHIFDPRGILNPGVKSGVLPDPLGHNKYDPTELLSSARARSVLDRVEEQREYDSCRLELLDVTG